MTILHPSSFFDLKNFQHAALFENCEFVWEALSRIEKYFASVSLGNIELHIPDGVYLEHPELISIGKGTILEPGAYIKGPCIIGEGCTIRHGAYIRGGLITGNDCVIGSEVKNAIFLNHALAGHFAYIGDSILGHDVNIGAGTKLANLRFDRKNIQLLINGTRYDTGVHKFGAILGDGAQTGCNSVTNPGTLFGKGACCYPCVNVGGYIAPRQVIRK